MTEPGADRRPLRKLAATLLTPNTVALAAIAGYIILHGSGGDRWAITALFAAVIFGRTACSLLYKPSTRNASRVRRAALIVPFYNESDEGLRRTFGSIAGQTRLPDEVFIVNDGSPIGADEVERWLPLLRKVIPRVEYIVLAENKGKRSALCAAISQTDCDVIITTDSDTLLRHDAIVEILRPFASRKVAAVTGRIQVRNRFRNGLTLLQEVIYAVAFLHGRAALSRMGSVLVCSGALAAYRRSAIEPYLSDFLRKPWMFGEDRHLTNYALRHGRVVLQESAVAMTDVPERMRHYLRQQTRWQRGFLQQSIWVLQHFPLDNRVFWMTFGNTAIWLFMTTMIPFMLVGGIAGGIILHGLIAHLLVSWTHLARYVDHRGDGRLAIRLVLLAVGPLFGFAQTLLMTPVRLYALATFGAKGWGSRIRPAAACEAQRTLLEPVRTGSR